MSDDLPVHGTLEAQERVWGRGHGWFPPIMAQALDDGEKLPCHNKSNIYDAAHSSPIARRAAALICTQSGCILQENCARAAIESGYAGVWGGKFNGKNVSALTPDAVRRWFKNVLDNEKIAESEYLQRFSAVIPSLPDVLAGVDVEIKDGCLNLVYPEPRLAVILRRRITDDAIMLGQETPGCGRIELTCGEFGRCIAPWHMQWYRDHHATAINGEVDKLNICLALYAMFDAGWHNEPVAQITGMDRLFVAQLRRVAEVLSPVEPFLAGTASDIISWYALLSHRPVGAHEAGALLTITRVGLELSCFNIAQLRDVGAEHF